MKKEKDYTGFPGDCSDKQLAVLEEFKKEVYGRLGLPNPPYDDAYLLRFCRARKFVLADVMTMFENFLAWRKENNVDEVDSFVFNELSAVKTHYPHGYHKTDKAGRPIYIERIGQLKIDEVFKVTDEERLLRYYIQSYELLIHNLLPACTLAKGKVVDQTCTILDLKGGGMGMMTKKVYRFIQIASKMCQDNYPEILGKMYIVNAPMLFSGVWVIIKPWLDQRTKDKIKILGSSYQKELLKDIDAENLPDFLGGTSTHELSENIGPWNPEGDKFFFGEEKNVQLDRNIVNQVEWLQNQASHPAPKQEDIQAVEQKMDEVLNI